jgi:hypothetical protein
MSNHFHLDNSHRTKLWSSRQYRIPPEQYLRDDFWGFGIKLRVLQMWRWPHTQLWLPWKDPHREVKPNSILALLGKGFST